MKNCIFALAILMLATVVAAQPEVSVPPAASFEAYRPVGEIRLWNFEIKTVNIGTLVSTVTEKTEVDGRPAYIIGEKLALDFTKAGSELSMAITGQQMVTSEGHFVSSEQLQMINGQQSNLTAKRDDDMILAETKAGSESYEQKVPLPSDAFVYDLFFLDQIELYFAMNGIDLGKSYSDTMFSPQPMLATVFSCFVIDYKWQGLFTGKYDSVFVVNVSSPEPARLYITKDFRLMKADFVTRDLKVYLDAVTRGAAAAQTARPPVTGRKLVLVLPAIGVYLAMAAIVLLLVGWDGFQFSRAYLGLLIGAVIYAGVPLVQHPMQGWVITTVLAPYLKGGAIWLFALLPAFLAAFIQTGLTSGAVVGIKKWFSPGKTRLAIVGGFLGAGFGVTEAAYMSIGTPTEMIFSWGLVEKAAFIVFHVAAGALLGFGASHLKPNLFRALVIVIAVNTLIRYLPLFVQKGIVQLELMYIVLAFIALAFLVFVLLVLRQKEPKESPVPRVEQPAV